MSFIQSNTHTKSAQKEIFKLYIDFLLTMLYILIKGGEIMFNLDGIVLEENPFFEIDVLIGIGEKPSFISVFWTKKDIR